MGISFKLIATTPYVYRKYFITSVTFITKVLLGRCTSLMEAVSLLWYQEMDGVN